MKRSWYLSTYPRDPPHFLSIAESVVYFHKRPNSLWEVMALLPQTLQQTKPPIFYFVFFLILFLYLALLISTKRPSYRFGESDELQVCKLLGRAGGRTGRHFFVIIPNRKTTAISEQREVRTKNAVFVYRLIKSCTPNKNAFMKEK